MQRDLNQLTGTIFDVVIIGGGIYGATLAWEAASRGLAVALVEKGDFASATSANSLKIIHGGFRYLQHLDIGRMRESLRERRVLMGIAPHLVTPLPVLLPTYGHGMRGRELLALGLAANDLLSWDRNFQGLRLVEDPQKWIPNGNLITKRETLARLPGLEAHGLTGGIVFYDAQVTNSERLVLAFVQAAAGAGAVVANYAEVTGFLREGGRVTGVRIADRLADASLEVRGRVVLNAAGPWAMRVLAKLDERLAPPLPLAQAVNLVTLPIFQGMAVGIYGDNGYGDDRSFAKKGSSLLFSAPWRDHSLIGTSYRPYTGDPDDLRITGQDVQILLDSFNRAYPAAALQPEAVSFVHAGLLPALPFQADGPVQLENHPRIIDHGRSGAPGLISVIGVKYTTARRVAVETIDRVYRLWGSRPAPSVSAEHPLPGGEIRQVAKFLQAEIHKGLCNLGAAEIRSLIAAYGSDYPKVLRFLPDTVTNNDGRKAALLQSQVTAAVRVEMAQKLSDVVFRRTDLGSAGKPACVDLELCAQIMAQELGWDDARRQAEIEAVERGYQYV